MRTWHGRQIETLLTEVKKVKMELYGYEFIRETDLTHHGILGQKWGKKNGPPYPLDEKDHSKAEQKAGWQKSLNRGPSIDSISSKRYNAEKRIQSGKRTARRILLGVGALAVGSLAVGVAMPSGANDSGADSFDNDAYLKSLMLRYSGSDKKKLYSKDGRRIVASHKFAAVTRAAKGRMPSGAKPGDIYRVFHEGYTYLCEVNDDLTPKILSYSKSSKKK